MKIGLILIWAVLLRVEPLAGEQLHATLEPLTNATRPGWFMIHITNVSSNSIRFLDDQEGSCLGGEFYEITVWAHGKPHKSNGRCFYAAGGFPRVVEIGPGKTYDRAIQPVAYIESFPGAADSKAVTVEYRLSGRMKRDSQTNAPKADLDLTFRVASQNIIELGGPVNGSQPIRSETNRVPSAARSRR